MPSTEPKLGVWQSGQPTFVKSLRPFSHSSAVESRGVRSTGRGSDPTYDVIWSHCSCVRSSMADL